jgi:hypothetical protein
VVSFTATGYFVEDREENSALVWARKKDWEHTAEIINSLVPHLSTCNRSRNSVVGRNSLRNGR